MRKRPQIFLLSSLVLALLVGCGSAEGPDPATGNPPSETVEEFKARIEASSIPTEEKQQKLAEIERMKQMNEEFLKRGPNTSVPTRPQTGNPN
jgi:hypothetical protein